MTFGGHEPRIVLCEGDNDYKLIECIARGRARKYSYEDKEQYVVRRAIDNELCRLAGKYEFLVVVEGGKKRLERNAALLVSKLRSISRTIEIFVLIDSDSSDQDSVKEAIGKIYGRIQDIIKAEISSASS